MSINIAFAPRADDLLVYVRFRRGMIEAVHCSTDRFLKVGSRILETFPLVNVLCLYKTQGRGVRLAEQPELSAMRSLMLMQLADDDCQWIFRSLRTWAVLRNCESPCRVRLIWRGFWICLSRDSFACLT